MPKTEARQAYKEALNNVYGCLALKKKTQPMDKFYSEVQQNYEHACALADKARDEYQKG
jgi:hypothetical protein